MDAIQIFSGLYVGKINSYNIGRFIFSSETSIGSIQNDDKYIVTLVSTDFKYYTYYSSNHVEDKKFKMIIVQYSHIPIMFSDQVYDDTKYYNKHGDSLRKMNDTLYNVWQIKIQLRSVVLKCTDLINNKIVVLTLYNSVYFLPAYVQSNNFKIEIEKDVLTDYNIIQHEPVNYPNIFSVFQFQVFNNNDFYYIGDLILNHSESLKTNIVKDVPALHRAKESNNLVYFDAFVQKRVKQKLHKKLTNTENNNDNVESMFLNGYIVLFSNSYYKGQTYYINTKRLEKYKFDLNDLYVGSIIIPSIYKQIRIEDNNGNTKPIISDVSNLNTNVTKMYVELEDPVILKYLSEGSVLLYTESSFKGKFKFIKKEYVYRNDIEIRDFIGSLKIPDDLMVSFDTESIGYVGKIPKRSSTKYVTNIYIKKREFIQFEPAPAPAIVPEPAPFKPSTSYSQDSTFIGIQTIKL